LKIHARSVGQAAEYPDPVDRDLPSDTRGIVDPAAMLDVVDYLVGIEKANLTGNSVAAE
jgi:hypothetical protein